MFIPARQTRGEDWQQSNSYHTAPPSITDILSHPLTGTREHFLALWGILADLCCSEGWKTMTSPTVIHPATHTQLSSPCEHDSVASILHVYYVWLYVSSWGQPHQTQKPKWLSSTEHQSYLTMSAHIHPNMHIFAI